MIRGLGIDLIEIERVADALARHGDRLLDRLLTPGERAFASRRGGRGLAAHVAGRFAAKEAALKALGLGLANGLRWHDVEVVAAREHARPAILLHGGAREHATALGVERTHLSITHDVASAAAVVVLEGA